jgi:hypothetical protein
VPDGASITSGQGTNSITVKYGLASGNVTVYAENYCGKSAVTSLAVTVNAPPSVFIAITDNYGLQEIAEGNPVTLAASGANTYSWTSVPAGFTSTSAAITVNPIVNTTYSVTGTSTGGCSSTASKTAL